MSPAAVEVRSPIEERNPSSGFDFVGGGESRRSEPAKARPRLVKVRKQAGLRNPRSRNGVGEPGSGFNPFGGGGNPGLVFGVDRSGEDSGFVSGLRKKDESCVDVAESDVFVFGGNDRNGSVSNLNSENCGSETEVKKSSCSGFVFGKESNLNSEKREADDNIGTGFRKVEASKSDKCAVDPVVFGSSSNGESFNKFASGNVETQVKNPCGSSDNNDAFSSTGSALKLPDELRKLNINDSERSSSNISSKLFSSDGNGSKSTRRRNVSRGGNKVSNCSIRNRKTNSCDKGSEEGHSLGSEKVECNIFGSSKVNDVLGTSGSESFKFQAGLCETNKVDPIHYTEHKASFSSNRPEESVCFVEEKKFGESSKGSETPLCNPCSLRESLFPKFETKVDVKCRLKKDKRLRETRRKLKKPVVKLCRDQDNASKEGSFREEINTSGCYSPMDFSPCQESAAASNQYPKETHSTPMKSNIPGKNPSVSNFGHKGTGGVAVDSAAKFSQDEKNQETTQPKFVFTPGLDDKAKSYMFSATSTEQGGPSATRHRYRRKIRIGATNIKSESSSVQSSPPSRNAKVKQMPSPTVEVHETCENWRLRGNEAYNKEDLSRAEAFYTQGIVSVPLNERSGNALEPLLLCYSNRAAARMSLQRVREAIGDCAMAVALDPNFLKAHKRAANCHLLLGEIDQALQYFSKCLEIGAGVCLDRKIILEAADGQQKAQKVVEGIDRSAKLLEDKSPDAAHSSLEIISEALSICPYSEKLLRLNAEALIKLRRHEETIQLCEQSLAFAEKNFTPTNVNGSNSHANLWRWFLMAKSYFLLGKLETALPLLDKLKQVASIDHESAQKDMESATSLDTTIRGLLHTKNAGNEAFKTGRYLEAVEHYTVALSSNVESRHFAAICFCNRAAAHQALGQITDAIADCSLAIALDGNYTKAVCRRSMLHEMIRDYGEAATDLRRLITILESQPCDKSKESGSSGRSTGRVKELREAQKRLPVMEQEAKSEVSLDFYLILGSKTDDTSAGIKKAYHKAALKHHPDKAGQFLARSDSGDEGRLWKEISQEVHKDADRLFKMIGEAYAVLSDSSKRSQYDLEEELRKASKAESGSSSQRRQSGSRSSSCRRPDFQGSPFESSFRQSYKDNWKTHGNSYSRW